MQHLKTLKLIMFGMAIYEASKASLYGNFEINTIIAESQLTKNEIMNDISLPNADPFVCSFRIGDVQWDPTHDYTSLVGENLTVVIKDHSDNVCTNNIYGFDSCSKRIGDMTLDGIGYDYHNKNKDNKDKQQNENINAEAELELEFE